MVRPSVVHDNFVSGGDEDGCLCEQLSLFLALLLLVGFLNVMRGQRVKRLHSVIFRPEMDTKVRKSSLQYQYVPHPNLTMNFARLPTWGKIRDHRLVEKGLKTGDKAFTASHETYMKQATMVPLLCKVTE